MGASKFGRVWMTILKKGSDFDVSQLLCSFGFLISLKSLSNERFPSFEKIFSRKNFVRCCPGINSIINIQFYMWKIRSYKLNPLKMKYIIFNVIDAHGWKPGRSMRSSSNFCQNPYEGSTLFGQNCQWRIY